MARPLIQGKYKILSLLGRGGMGTVYRVMHDGLKREDALKKLHEQYAADFGFVDRFMREARAMARLDHPNIIRIYDVFADGDANYIAMEYFPGQSLGKLLEESNHLDQETAIFIIKQLASALAYAHKQGIVHRDIKPGNVLVKPDNTVKIADFGIAAVADELTLTATGQMVGSPHYMSPEQARGDVIDHRSDLFSLGMVLYEMVTGRMLFEGNSSVAIIGKLAYSEKELPFEFPPQVSESLQGVIRKLLARNLDDRYQTADELLGALADLDKQPIAEPLIEKTIAQQTIAREVIPQQPLSPTTAKEHIPELSQSATVVQARTPPLPAKSTKPKRVKFNRVTAVLAAGLVGTVVLLAYVLMPNIKIELAEAPTRVSTIADTQNVDAKKQHDHQQPSTSAPNDISKQDKNQFQPSAEPGAKLGATKSQSKKDQALASKSTAKEQHTASRQQLTQPKHSENNLDAKLLAQINADLNKLDKAIKRIKQTKRAAEAAAAKQYAAKNYKKAQQKWWSLNKARDQAIKAKNNNKLAQAQKLTKDSLALSKQTNQAFNLAKKNADRNKLLAEINNDKSLLEALKKRTNTTKQNAIKADAVASVKELFQLASAEEIQAEQYSISMEQQLKQGRADSARQALNQAYEKYQTANRMYEQALNTAKATAEAESQTAVKSSSDDFDILQRKFHELSVAYEQKDIPKLQAMSHMSDKRLMFVKKIFDRYEKIEVSVENIRLRKGVATATLVIDQLIKRDGHISLPADSWKTAALQAKKQQNGWSKIQW